MQDVISLKRTVDYEYGRDPNSVLFDSSMETLSHALRYHRVCIRKGKMVLLMDWDKREYTMPQNHDGVVTGTMHPNENDDVKLTVKLKDGDFPYDSFIVDWKDVQFLPNKMDKIHRMS